MLSRYYADEHCTTDEQNKSTSLVTSGSLFIEISISVEYSHQFIEVLTSCILRNEHTYGLTYETLYNRLIASSITTSSKYLKP